MADESVDNGAVLELRRRVTDRRAQDHPLSERVDLITQIIEAERRAADAYRESTAKRIDALEQQSAKSFEELSARVQAQEEFQRTVMRRVFWLCGVGFAFMAAFAGILYLLEWLGPTVVREMLRGMMGTP